MKLNTRAIRNTAFIVLLAWLFSLASGVVNACLLEARGTHSHIAIAASSETTQAPVLWPGHAGAVADPNDDSHTFKAPCLKVCDDGSRSLSKQNLTLAQTDPGPAPFVLILWTAATPVDSSFRRMVAMQPATPGMPLRVRYSRLVL